MTPATDFAPQRGGNLDRGANNASSRLLIQRRPLQMNTRTIAIVALAVAVVIAIILLV